MRLRKARGALLFVVFLVGVIVCGIIIGGVVMSSWGLITKGSGVGSARVEAGGVVFEVGVNRVTGLESIGFVEGVRCSCEVNKGGRGWSNC